MIDTRRDLVMALAVLVLGVLVIYLAGTIGEGVYRDTVGPRAFPYAVGILLAVGGGFLVARRLQAMHAGEGYLTEGEGSADEDGHPASGTRAIAIMVLTVAFAAALEPAGYLIATPIFVAAAFLVMGERRLLMVAAIALIWTAVTYLVFAQVLHVRLPVGPFNDWFRTLGLTAY